MAATSLVDRFLGRRTPRSSAPARRQAPVPWALVMMVPAICLYYIAAFVLVINQASIELAALVMIAFGIVNALLSTMILQRLRGYELPSEQRQHVRLYVDLDATVDGAPCRVNDLSLGGASVLAAGPSELAVGDESTLEFALHEERFAVEVAVVRRREMRGTESELALRYQEGQGDTVARIAMALLSEAPADHAIDAVDPLPLSA